MREAHRITGVAAADFSRIRGADLGRFSLDRLVRIINTLDEETDGTGFFSPGLPDLDGPACAIRHVPVQYSG